MTTVCKTPELAAREFLTNHDLLSDDKLAELTSLVTEVVACSFRSVLGIDDTKLTMEDFLKEIVASEPGSKTSPGLQISWLEDRQQFYAAIHVFPMGTVESRQVLVKSLAVELTQCLVKLLLAYRELRR